MSDASHITNFTTHVSQTDVSPIIIRNFTTQSLQTNM